MAQAVVRALRELLVKNNIGYYLILTQDEHDSEYVSAADKRRDFVSGFTGSAGTAVVGHNYAELATDGRYFLAAAQQLDDEWILRKEGAAGVHSWYTAVVARARAEKVDIGVDPKLISWSYAQKILEELHGSGCTLRPITSNLVDEIWGPNKPAQPASLVSPLGNQYTGQTYGSKVADLRTILARKKVDAIVLSALDEIAWFYNLRGNDIEFNPVFKSYAIVTASESVLYINSDRLAPGAPPPGVDVRPYNQVFDDLASLAAQQKNLWVPRGSSWALMRAATPPSGVSASSPDNGPLDVSMSPISLAKSVKNHVEIDGAREAQIKCGLSIVRYLSWLQHEISVREVSEYEGSCKLHEFRESLPEFRGESFETISSSGANAAIIHYKPLEEGSAVIKPCQIYLLDTGCQFTHGTTDTTRTVHFGVPSTEEKEAYTLVLKGHIALATSVFPVGTTGYQLDAVARKFLWSRGLDYRHGTGHGVGSYLNVHEGPVGIHKNPSRAPLNVFLQEGNLISNEPGYYEDGKFGVRIENLIVVQRAKTKHQFGDTPYLTFETITLVPLDRNLIDEALLTPEEKKWINEYHQRVHNALWNSLDMREREWLSYHTKPY